MNRRISGRSGVGRAAVGRTSGQKYRHDEGTFLNYTSLLHARLNKQTFRQNGSCLRKAVRISSRNVSSSKDSKTGLLSLSIHVASCARAICTLISSIILIRASVSLAAAASVCRHPVLPSGSLNVPNSFTPSNNSLKHDQPLSPP